MLKIINLKASIKDRQILTWVNLQVWLWELHVILWPNGSGKSTLWKALLSHPQIVIDSWEMIFNWKNVNNLKTHEKASLGMFLSHQHPSVVDGVSSFELLRAAQKVTWEHIGIIKYKKIVKDIFKKCHLKDEFLERDFNKWASWWEVKKMEIATLLSLDNFSFAFLDEIDSGLDFDALSTVVNWIKDFLTSWQKSVLLITHSKQILSKIKPDYLHIFCDWKIIKSGWMDLLNEVNEKGYAWIKLDDKCEICEKKDDCLF